MTASLDVAKIRADFPILERRVHGKPLVFLDSAASSQKPTCVIEAMNDYYRTTHANVHRGVYTLSEEATALYEGARKKIAKFINAPSSRENHLHPQHHRVDQPRRVYVGTRAPRRGRRASADRVRASQQHRAVADGGERKGRAGSLPAGRCAWLSRLPRRWIRC